MQSQDIYRVIFDAAVDMIWVRELDSGVILDANAATLKNLGYAREELLGRSVLEFWREDPEHRPYAAFTEAVRRDGAGVAHATLRTRTGKPLEVEIRGSLMTHAGRPAVISVARDMSGALLEQRRGLTLFQAFQQSNDVMFYTDRNGTILDINPAFTKVYGYAREEAVGQTPRILRSRHSSLDMYQRMWSGLLSRGHWRGQLINRSKDGREIPVVLTITAVRDGSGGILGYVSNAADISEQLAMQSRVAHSEALASLGEMAAVVAHEIRNPLGSIVMAAKQLAGGRLAREDEDLVFRVLRDESQRLNETLSNFLAYARPRELKLSRGSLSSLVGEICRMVESNPDLLQEVRLEASLDESLEPFPFDADQIRQVVWNIVLNAIQAMEGRGTVKLRTGREGARAFLRVEDTGPGIPQAARPTLFKPFHTTKRQGTGLGLAIAQRIVHAHGGDIRVESEPGRGAAFTIQLPAVQE